MTRKRYLIPITTLVVLMVWAFSGTAEDVSSDQAQPLTPQELAVLAGDEPPKTHIEQLEEVVNDDRVTVHSEDGRTVLQMEGEPEDEFTLSFSSVANGVRAHVKLGKGGLSHRFTLVKPEGNDTPIYLDLKGPAVNGGYGVKVTLRF